VPRLLADEEVDRRLKKLPDWKREGKFLARTYEFKTFRLGIRFINSVAKVADELDHHPDIAVRYTTVKLSIQTHSAGGLTSRDFRLVSAIERATSGFRL
jgi:4a-hydroxytetrahydrobiopterin dehydratase